MHRLDAIIDNIVVREVSRDCKLASLMIRNLKDDVKEKLRVRAAANGHSMEAEARAVLEAAVAEGAEGKRSLGDIFDAHFGDDVRADLTEYLAKRDNEQPLSPFE